MNRFEPRVERLMAILRDGIGESQDVRTELSLRDDATDDDVARSLVQIVSACAVATAGETEGTKEDVSEETDDPRRSALDGSLLGQLEGKGESAVEALDDTSTLMAILRAGRLNQRRAALRRLTRGVVSRSLRGDELKALANMLDGLRDVDLEYELIHARLGLIGRRAARAEREAWERRIGELETAIAEFWEAAAHEEPLASTASESRAQLLLRFRDVPDLVASHVSALLEGDADQQHALLLSLRHAADPRLVPALKAVLEDGGPMLALDAARALRRIDDPRVRPMLAGAYERSPRDVFRAIVGGALADHGDDRALDYVRGLLEREDDEALLAALEGLESLGTAEDSET
ncbi:MAG: HEAT repeat domain-containing protein, partial [Myxococcota bacterium]